MLTYAAYGIFVSQEIGEDIHSSDVVMANGYNWLPPLAFVDYIGGKDTFARTVKIHLKKEFLDSIDFDHLALKIDKSKYDYRQFLKAF
jgi:3-hydroxyacyl-CoA dehydrogenase